MYFSKRAKNNSLVFCPFNLKHTFWTFGRYEYFWSSQKASESRKSIPKRKKLSPKNVDFGVFKKNLALIKCGAADGVFLRFSAFFLKNPNPIKCREFGRLSAVNGCPRRSGLLGVQSVPHHSIEGPEDGLRLLGNFRLRVPNPVKSVRVSLSNQGISYEESYCIFEERKESISWAGNCFCWKGNMSTISGNEEGNDAWMR